MKIKSKKTACLKLLKILIVAFVLIVTICLGIYYWPLVVSTRGWHTYKNQTYGYQLKIPQKFVLRPPGGGYDIDDVNWRFTKEAERINWNYALSKLSGGIVFDIYISSSKDFSQACNEEELKKGYFDPPSISKVPPMSGVKFNEYIQLSGLNKLSHEPYWTSDVCFLKQGKKYFIIYRAYQSRQADSTFYTILSSFRFTQ